MNEIFEIRHMDSPSDHRNPKTCTELSRIIQDHPSFLPTIDNPKSKIQNPKWGWGFALALAFVFGGAVAEAQQPKKVAHLCYLGNAVSGRQAICIKMFRERLREIGYIEGQNITIDYRYWEGKIERLPGLASEFVGLNCDVIVT